jgi:hypothetical protein
MIRLYHLVSVRVDNGAITYLTKTPMKHAQCMIYKSKLTAHAFRRIELKEVTQ